MSKTEKPIPLQSREYKVMLDHLRFGEAQEAVSAFWAEVQHQVQIINVEAKGTLKNPQQRIIQFFDTPDHSFRQNGFVLRYRREIEGDLQYTLKCRSPDRFIAAGASIEASKHIPKHIEPETKFEEDIGPPFISRFSHSNTLTFEKKDELPFDKIPKTIGECALLFPKLKKLRMNGLKLPTETPVGPVNDFKAHELVFKGGTLDFHDKLNPKESKSKVAVILWSLGVPGRPLVAEFSFKYKDKNDDQHFNRTMAIPAKQCFETIQKMDWILKAGRTKTAYVYGD